MGSQWLGGRRSHTQHNPLCAFVGRSEKVPVQATLLEYERNNSAWCPIIFLCNIVYNIQHVYRNVFLSVCGSLCKEKKDLIRFSNLWIVSLSEKTDESFRGGKWWSYFVRHHCEMMTSGISGSWFGRQWARMQARCLHGHVRRSSR